MAIAKLRNPTQRTFSQALQRPQGAPRGLLNYYILYRISQGHIHGYEISQSIEEKTQGAWRPGAGSIYPTLKRLEKEGLIRAIVNSKYRGAETSQRTYEITPEGSNCLKEGKDILASAGRKWAMMRGIFIDMMDTNRISTFLLENSKSNFQTAQEIIDSKLTTLNPSDAEFTLKEYALNLERQLKWTRTKLSQLEKKAARVSVPNH
ncbi:MAG TPA: PadR family transcriptional regulator [Nitrososphaerales archaeon]|nr:PadR family transcriptional regulator [Nitrososphaerales archaeon]